jgi:hypothetical protein
MGPILFLLTILTLLVHIWAESINHMKLSIDSDVKTQSQLFEHRSHNNQMGRDVNASKGKFKTHHHRKLVGDDEAATTDDEAAATDDEAATTDDTAGDDTDLYIDLDLYFVVDNWPTDSSEVTSSIESILKTFISTAADVDANDISSFEYSSSIIDTATDDEAATTDDEAATTDDEAAATDDEAAATDDEAAATDDEAATAIPTARPTTRTPTAIPTAIPTARPTTRAPTAIPTAIPTAVPTTRTPATDDEAATTDDEAAATDDEAATTDDEAATTDDVGRRQLKGYDGHRRLVANYYTLTVTFTLNVIASMKTLVLSNFAAGVTDSILLNQLIADLNADCGCSDYSDISITDSGLVTSEDNSSNSDNFVYLAFLVLLIIPIAWYYWPVKANRAGINSESSVFKTFSLKELFGKKNNDFKPKSTATSFSVFTTPTTYVIRNVKTKEEMQGMYDALHRAYVSGNKV